MSGKAYAHTRFPADLSPAPMAYSNNGFRQAVEKKPDGIHVRVGVTPDPLSVREPFFYRPRKKGGLPAWLGDDLKGALSRELSRCRRLDEAVRALFLRLRISIEYVERPDFEETPEEVCRRKRASCVGMTRLSLSLLRTLGISAREVLGLRLPPATGDAVLEGGVLHAWIEVDMGDAGRCFCDPWGTVGWVPETLVVLRVGGGLEIGGLKALHGCTVRVLERRDRIVYQPESDHPSVLWTRPAFRRFSGTLVTGKVLGPGDRPAEGRVVLGAGKRETAMELWKGNFFFRNLEPGHYRLRIEVEGGVPEAREITVGPMDKQFILVYSQKPREEPR